jgi:hypothetical protein
MMDIQALEYLLSSEVEMHMAHLACGVVLPLLLYFVILPMLGITFDMPQWAR